MTTNPIPEGYHSITPFILVKNPDKVIDFAKRGLGAKEVFRLNTPDGTLMHAEIKVGDSIVMIGDPMGKPGCTACLYVYTKDADSLFNQAVAAGGEVVEPLADQFYGDRSGGVKDPAGNVWFISTHVEDVAPDELARRAKARKPEPVAI